MKVNLMRRLNPSRMMQEEERMMLHQRLLRQLQIREERRLVEMEARL
jgi:hypothetical protein